MDNDDWIARTVGEHERPLMQYATHLLRDPEAARDVVQEVFCRLCRQSPAELDGHLTQWLYTVCRNCATDKIRKDRRMKPLSEMALLERDAGHGRPDTPLETQEELSAALRAVATLPPRQQELVRLKFQQGLSYREIAAVTGLSLGNVGFLLHTAIAALRERLGVNHEGHEGTKDAKRN